MYTLLFSPSRIIQLGLANAQNASSRLNKQVWARMQGFRWWPAVHWNYGDVPRTVQDIKPKYTAVCLVRFFGAPYEFAWIPSLQRSLEEWNDVTCAKNSKKPNKLLTIALDEASRFEHSDWSFPSCVSQYTQSQSTHTASESQEDIHLPHINAEDINYDIEKMYCLTCRTTDREDLLLLCDWCNNAQHTFCQEPPLSSVPKGCWLCAACASYKASGGARKREKPETRTIKLPLKSANSQSTSHKQRNSQQARCGSDSKQIDSEIARFKQHKQQREQLIDVSMRSRRSSCTEFQSLEQGEQPRVRFSDEPKQDMRIATFHDDKYPR
jgi:hypothetical protein